MVLEQDKFKIPYVYSGWLVASANQSGKPGKILSATIDCRHVVISNLYVATNKREILSMKLVTVRKLGITSNRWCCFV